MADPVYRNCTSETPDAITYFQLMGTVDLVLVILALVGTLITVGIYVEELLIMYHHFREWRIRHRAIWLLGIYPVVSFTSLCIVCVPRSTTLNSLVSSIYFSVCMWLFVRLMMDYYKGCKETMARHLSHTVIRFNTPPACCCCACLPTAAVSKSNIWRLEVLVLQYVILQPLLVYVNTVIYMDSGRIFTGNEATNKQSTFGSFLGSVSTTVALYAYFILFFLVRQPLRHTSVLAKFYCLQIVLILTNIQRFIFDILATTEVIKCTAMLSAVYNANKMHHIALIFEMMLVSIVARVYYKRDMEDSKTQSDIQDIIARGQHSDSVSSVGSVTNRRGDIEDGIHNHTVDYGALSSTSTNSIRSTATGEHITKQPQGAENSPYPDMTLIQPSWRPDDSGMAMLNPTENPFQNQEDNSSLNRADINKYDIKGSTEDQSNV